MHINNSLIDAIRAIASHHAWPENRIGAIEYEDGSGFCFNYSDRKTGLKYFARLNNDYKVIKSVLL